MKIKIEIKAKTDLSYQIARDINDMFATYLEGDGHNNIIGNVTVPTAQDLLEVVVNPTDFFRKEWEGFDGFISITVFSKEKKVEGAKNPKSNLKESFDGDIMTFADFCDDMEFSLKMSDAFKSFVEKTGEDIDDESAAPRTEWLRLLDDWKNNGDYWDLEDNSEDDAKDQFTVELVDEEGNVGYITFNKNGGKWIGRFVPDASDPGFETPSVGLTYMGYLDPQDVTTWIRKDGKGKYTVSIA